MYNDEYMFDVVDGINDVYPTNKRANIKRFNGFFPLVQDKLLSEDNECIFSETTPECLDRQVNVSILNTANYDGALFMSLQKANIKDVRGIKKKVCPVNPYKLSTWFYTTKGLDFIEENFLNITKNSISYIGNKRSDLIMLPYRIKEMENATRILLGVQFMLENMPCVYIKEADAALGYTLPLEDIAMLKSLFKLRDIEPSKERRTALRHIVHSHTRTVNKNTAKEFKTFVKQHLRGQTDFNWFGMECKIHIPV